MTVEELIAFQDAHEDDFLEFEHVEHKRSKRADLHAFLLMDEIVPGDGDMVCCAEHDEIWLDVPLEDLAKRATEAQLIELFRCGVRIDSDTETLAMFV